MEPAIRKDLNPNKPRAYSQVVAFDKFKGKPQVLAAAQKRRELFFILQEILANLHQSNLKHAGMAYNLQRFFEELVYAETGLQSLRYGLRMFLDKLCAEPVVTKLVYFLFKQIQKCLHTRQSGLHDLDQQIIAGALQEVFDWYVERSASMEDILSSEEPSLNYDQIFNLNVLHDQKAQTFLGFEVLAGLALFGRAGQNFWFKVFVKEEGEDILPHIEWNSWIDDTEIFTVRKLNEAAALSAIVPLVPQTQRFIIDRLNIFIPYQALDVSPGKHEVQVEVCLYNEKGDRLLEAVSEQVLSVARNQASIKPIVSQQALGIWEKDFVSGDAVKNVEVVFIRQPQGDWLSDLIRVRFDFEVYDRMNENLNIELRFYNSRGGLVECLNAGKEDPYQALRHCLYIDEIIYRRFDVELAVPRSQMVFEQEDRIAACEISLLSTDNRVLCGALEYFKIPEAVAISKDSHLKAEKIDSIDKPGKESKGFFSRLFNK